MTLTQLCPAKTQISLVYHAPTRISRPAGILQGSDKLGRCATGRFFPAAGAGFGSNTNTWRRYQMLSLPAVHRVDPVARSDRLQQLQSRGLLLPALYVGY